MLLSIHKNLWPRLPHSELLPEVSGYVKENPGIPFDLLLLLFKIKKVTTPKEPSRIAHYSFTSTHTMFNLQAPFITIVTNDKK